MTRRELIALLGSAAVAWPLIAACSCGGAVGLTFG